MELEPKFYSDASLFQVTLYNLNYGQTTDKAGNESQKQAIATSETGDYLKKQAIEQRIHRLHVKQTTKVKILTLFNAVGFEQVFGRTDMSRIIGITVSPAGEMLRKLREAGLIAAVKGYGKGKYKFVKPSE